MLPDELPGLTCNIFIAPHPFQPMDLRLAPKPGGLALGVIAMALLGLRDGLFAGEFAPKHG